MRHAAVVAAALTLGACSKSPPASTEPARTPVAAAPMEVKPGALVADEAKLLAFLAYQEEMAPVTKEVTAAATGAYGAGARDRRGMEAALSRDDRIARFNEADAAARAKSGLSSQEVNAMGGALTEYAAALWILRNAEAAGKKQGGPGGAFARLHEEEFGKAKAKFAEKHGEQALAQVTRHEPELLAWITRTMAPAMGKR